jgi:hypothetical protein
MAVSPCHPMSSERSVKAPARLTMLFGYPQSGPLGVTHQRPRRKQSKATTNGCAVCSGRRRPPASVLVKLDILSGFADVLVVNFRLFAPSLLVGPAGGLECNVLAVRLVQSKLESRLVRLCNFLKCGAVKPNPVPADFADPWSMGRAPSLGVVPCVREVFCPFVGRAMG